MTTTPLIALLLGLVVAPAFLARAWAIGTGAAAALCGLIAAGALLVAVVLVALAVKARLP